MKFTAVPPKPMNELGQHIIGSILTKSRLRGRAREDLRRELESHLAEEANELSDQGKTITEIDQLLAERWINKEQIGAEIKKVYWQAYLRRWGMPIAAFVAVGFLLMLGPLLSLVWSIVTMPFSLAFAGFSSIIFVGLSVIDNLVFKRDDQTARLTAGTIVSAGSILLWVTLLFSERLITSPFSGGITNPTATAGFPWRALVYPAPPMGNDQVPFEMWPGFFANYIFWVVIALLAYHFIPVRFKNRDHQQLVISIGLALSGLGCLWLGLKFD